MRINILIYSSVVVLILSLPQKIQAQKRLYYHITTQYAGSIGFFSVGGGLSNKKNNMEHDLLYGYLPWYYGGESHKVSYKFSLQPFNVKLTKRLDWKVFNPGAFLSYNVAKSFGVSHDQSIYPKGYYWWSPALRVHVSFSTALYIKMNEESGSKVMLYLETNSNDRYLTSYFENVNAISFWDIWYFGIGGKYVFGKKP